MEELLGKKVGEAMGGQIMWSLVGPGKDFGFYSKYDRKPVAGWEEKWRDLIDLLRDLLRLLCGGLIVRVGTVVEVTGRSEGERLAVVVVRNTNLYFYFKSRAYRICWQLVVEHEEEWSHDWRLGFWLE